MQGLDKLILKDKIATACAWTGSTLRDNDSWVHALSQDEVAELDAVVNRIQNRGIKFPNFDRMEFQIPGLEKELRLIADELEMVLGTCPIPQRVQQRQ